MIRRYRYETAKWYNLFHLRLLLGSVIGSEVCFEIFEGCFNVLSNQTSYEIEEIDCTSFYTSFRCPLGSPCNAPLQKTEAGTMRGKEYTESSEDNRWTSFRIHIDETANKIRIVESRKELYFQGSRRQRAYYTTDVIFHDPRNIPESGSTTL